jgi:hypothetical protein
VSAPLTCFDVIPGYAMLTVDTSADPRLQFGRLACVFLAWIAVSGVARAAVLDQSQDGIKGSIIVGPSDQRIAQTFTPGLDGDLETVRLRIAVSPSLTPDGSDLLLEIMNTTDGVPNGVVLGTASLPHTAFPDATGVVPTATPYADFAFSGLELRAGTRYALALRAAANTCGSISCEAPAYRVDTIQGVDPYPLGQLFVASGVLPTFALDGDLSFQTYMARITPVPEPAGWLVFIVGIAALAGRRRLHSRILCSARRGQRV